MKRFLISVLLAMCLTIPALAYDAKTEKALEDAASRASAKEKEEANPHKDLGVIFQTPNGRETHLKERMTANNCQDELRKYGVSWSTGKPYVFTIEPTSSIGSDGKRIIPPPQTATGEVVDMVCVSQVPVSRVLQLKFKGVYFKPQPIIEHSSWSYAAKDTLFSLGYYGILPRRHAYDRYIPADCSVECL